jgi:hypothetical protein
MESHRTKESYMNDVIQTERLVEADEQTREWREKQFRLLGFATDAYALSLDRNIDLGLARQLIDGGCDVETALRIL